MGNFILKRPVTVIMLFSAFFLFGIISLFNFTIDLLPPVQYPEISVITLYPGAAPSEIEQLITRPIEEAVNSVAGVTRIRSESIEGASLVVATFKWGSNLDYSILKVREKVDLVKGILPRDVYKPIVARFDPNSLPIMNIAITSSLLDQRDLRYEIEKNIVPLFERIDGVGNAKVNGGIQRQIEVLINPEAMRAYGVGIYDIIDSIQSSHYNYPAGTILSGNQEYIIRTLGEFKSLTDIEEILIKKTNEGKNIFLKNVARVVDGHKEITGQSFINQKPCVTLSIIKESGKNTVQTSKKVNDVIRYFNNKYHGRIEFTVVSDNSQYIQSAISNVATSAFVGAIFAFVILYIFLQNFSSALLITIAIPISIIITFFFMNLFSININMMSLGGLSICIGMLVDCGIVVIESISKNKLSTNVITTLHSITPSLISSTLTSVVIFLPLSLIKGLGGALFTQLALTVTIALFISLVVALLLIPSLYVLLTHHPSSKRKNKKPFVSIVHSLLSKVPVANILEKVESHYSKSLQKLLEHPERAYIIIFIIIASGVLSFSILPKSLMPSTKQNQCIIRVECPPGTPLQHTVSILMYIDSIIARYPDIEHRLITAGYNPDDYTEYFGKEKNTNIGQITITANPHIDIQRYIQQWQQIIHLPSDILAEYSTPGNDMFAILPINTGWITIDCIGQTLTDIEQAVDSFINQCNKYQWISHAVKQIKRGKPEITIQADSDKLSFYGLSLQDIASHLHTAVYGTFSGKFFELDNEIDIITRFDYPYCDSFDDLAMIPISNQTTRSITLLKDIATLSNAQGYASIQRKNQQRCITIQISVSGISTYSALTKLQKTWEKLSTPAVSFSISHEIIETNQSLQSLYALLILSIVLTYMIIASQFESFTFPLYIMLSVPIALCGSSVLLLLTFKSINIMSLMGMVILIGTIVNNAILLLSTIVTYYGTDKKNISTAIQKACITRLRPIIMTSLTTLCGLLPLALGLQEGSDMQSPLAIAIIGGMISGTFFILLCFPILIKQLFKGSL